MAKKKQDPALEGLNLLSSNIDWEATKSTPKTAVINPEVSMVRATYEITEELYELVKRAAFWERKLDKAIVIKALQTYFEGKEYPELPEDYQPLKGRHKKKK